MALKQYFFTALLTIGFLSCQSQDESNITPGFNPGTLSQDAPEETGILGQLTGIWQADQTILKSDGNWAAAKNKAEWKWYYILDGHAIQDDWIVIDSAGDRSVAGTNIRIYNKDEAKWYMGWIDSKNRRLAEFTAINDGNSVVMTGTNAQGRAIRNTFYNISADYFDWKQEWTFDEGNTWTEVTKIKCTRINEAGN